MKDGYTATELAEILNLSKVGMLKRATKEEWPFESRSARGGYQRYYALDGLPADVRQQVQDYWMTRVDAASSVSEAPPQDPALSHGAGDSTGVGIGTASAGLFNGDLDDLKRWAQQRAIRLDPARLRDPKTPMRLDCARQVLEAPAYAGRAEVIDSLCRKYGKSAAQIRRYVRDVTGWRIKARTSILQAGDLQIELPRSTAFCEDALRYGISAWLNNHIQGVSWSYERLKEKAAAQGWKIGDYSSFARLIKELPAPVLARVREGAVGFELRHAPKVVRTWLDTPVYTVLCGDQNVLDYLVLDDITGEIIIMNLYLWMDCTSRAWVGMWPSFGPYRGYTVGYSLREALRFGLPDEIFTDWGKCELSNYVAEVRMNVSRYCGMGGFDDMGRRFSDIQDEIVHRLAKPGIPWSKPIENQMNILKRYLLDQNLPGFRQRLPDPWANKVRQEDLQKLRRGEKLLTTSQMLAALLKAMERHNREACQLKELRGGTIVPNEVLMQGLKNQHRTVLDDVTLDHVFLPSWVRTPHRGIVTAKVGPNDTRSYYAAQLTRSRDKVRVHVDPFDAEAPARLVDLNGNFLGLAEPWQAIGLNDDARLSEMIRAQRQLLKDWRGSVDQLLKPWNAGGLAKIGPADKPARDASQAERERITINNAKQRADAKIIQLYGG